MTIPNDGKTIPELISLLYVHRPGESDRSEDFSREKGFAPEFCSDPEAASELAKLKPPDLIIIESGKGDAQSPHQGSV